MKIYNKSQHFEGRLDGASRSLPPDSLPCDEKDKRYEVYFVGFEGWLRIFQRATAHVALPDHSPFFFLIRFGSAGGTRIVSPLNV